MVKVKVRTIEKFYDFLAACWREVGEVFECDKVRAKMLCSTDNQREMILCEMVKDDKKRRTPEAH